MKGPPPVITEPAPVVPSVPERKFGSLRRSVAILLSVCVAVFVADAVFSFADDSLILFFGLHILSFLRGLLSFIAVVMAVGVYALIGLTPMVPKRLVLPIPAFYLVAMLAIFPLAIYWYDRLQWIALGVSAGQVILAIALLNWARRGGKLSWPWIPVDDIADRRFSARNLFVFALTNALVVLPFVVVYIFLCVAQATAHFSEGFMALHPSGFTVQVRKYVRDDGKMIQLFPMAHVANPSFYQKVAQTFPTNSIVLMEGVTDRHNLLTNKISYKRMAKSLGLAEQKETFAPPRNEVVPADIDVGQFSTNTLGFLNLIMLIHAQGMTAENISKLMQFSPPPEFERQLFDDLLQKRNENLLGEIQSHLPGSDSIMVPWGVAHMPGIAREIQKAGFRLVETRDYDVIRFRGDKKQVKGAGQ